MPAPPLDWIALTAKLERAKEHIFKLEEFWRAHIEGGAYPIQSQDTPDVSYRLYSLGSVAPIPADVPLITGDAIQNLRSALDHLAYRLVCVGTDSDGPFDRVYFPIGARPKEFKARIRAIKKCLRPEAEEALAEMKAYPGGSGEIFWQLHQLNNIDKHRLLLTVTSQNRHHSMSPAEIATIRYQFAGPLKDIPEANDPRMFLKAGVRHLSLETGHVLDIFPISQVHKEMHFPIEVAFGEPEVVKGKPVIEMLHQAASLMHNIFMVFSSKGLLA
jgi:hypothetical protein